MLAGRRFFPGAVLGLQQSSVHLRVRVDPLPAADHARLEARMRAHLMEDFPAPESADNHTPSLTLARRCAQWTIALQRRARLAVSPRFHAAADAADPGAITLALPCTRPELAVAALAWTLDELRAVDGQGEAVFDTLMRQLREGARRGLNATLIAEAAYALGLPVQQPLPGVLLLGSGERARRFNSTLTERTSALGVRIARDKQSTASLLRRVGLPGAVHAPAGTPREAVEVATRLGYPVVVKPADRDQGDGVSADLRNPSQVEQAFAQARTFSERVLVERHCHGFTHRLTVVNGKLVKVAKRVAGGVVGDGIHTVEGLVRIAAQDPDRQRRASRTGRPLLDLDDEALGMLTQSGLDARTVPSAGTYVRLRRRDNINAGGSNVAIDPGAVHPENHALAIRAAELLHLDFAGIDLIIEDIGVSWLQCESLICEVNAQPQMGTSDTPGIYQSLLLEALPNGGRIPVSLLLPVSGNMPPVQKLLDRATSHFQAQTLSCAAGLFIGGTPITRAFRDGFQAATAALTAPQTRSLLCVMSAAEILAHGLPIDRVDRIALTEFGDADLPARAAARNALALVTRNADKVEQW